MPSGRDHFLLPSRFPDPWHRALGMTVFLKYVCLRVPQYAHAVMSCSAVCLYKTHVSLLSSSKPCQGSPCPTEFYTESSRSYLRPATQTTFLLISNESPAAPFWIPSQPSSERFSGGAPKPPRKFEQKHLQAQHQRRCIRISGWGAQASVF